MNYFEAEDSWKSNDEWRLADKEAAWKFFFAAGKDAPQKVISAQCVKMNQYENIIFEIRDQLAAAQVENERLENQVLARDAELWGRTQEILGLKEQLAAEQLNNKRLRKALEAVIKVHGYESGIPVEAISTQASTEALDKYVAEKVKEAMK